MSIRKRRAPRPGRRSTHSGIVDAQARCDDCPFAVFTRNAVGLAAQHADSNPDHTVRAEQSMIVIYNKKPKAAGS